MDLWFNFFLYPDSLEGEACEELSSCALQHASFSEDMETGERVLCAVADPSLFPNNWKHIESFAKLETSDINWGHEWGTFSPYFQNGLAQIPLCDFSPHSKEHLTLLPGPGFGDLSHPTTTLSLKLLAQCASEQTVIDLGCGSGILGLAALKWGARFVYGLDIDSEALKHTLENALFNNLENQILISPILPTPLKALPTLLVMNMIFKDQRLALESLSFQPSLWITSGILEEQKDAYLSWAQEQGLELLSCLAEEGWIACTFKKAN